jgi:glutathione S-transferase
VGTYLSPYVRKVLVCLDLKEIPYQIDPLIPFFGSEEFTRLNPLRRIPVFRDDSVTLADSSVICEYLDERHPGHALFPRDPALRARARWLEEFADTRLGQVLIWRLFNQLVINRFVWGKPAEEEVLRKTLEEEIPDVLGYLEGEVPGEAYLFGEAISAADVAVATFFRNASFAGFTVDPHRWPTTAAFVSRVLGHSSFLKLRPLEDLLLRTPIPRHREALREAGAPLAPDTLATSAPRPGILTP